MKQVKRQEKKEEWLEGRKVAMQEATKGRRTAYFSLGHTLQLELQKKKENKTNRNTHILKRNNGGKEVNFLKIRAGKRSNASGKLRAKVAVARAREAGKNNKNT